MNDWLEKDDMPEDTKTTMYAQQLQGVKQLKNQVVRPEDQNPLQYKWSHTRNKPWLRNQTPLNS